MMTQQYRSIDQTKIKILCDKVCDKIYDLLDMFGLEYKTNGKFISLKCPIHGGDNETAINIYPDGESYRGNWKCRTHQCEKVFKGSIIGFIRGVLSHQKYEWDHQGCQTVTFAEALKFATEFTNTDLENIKVDKAQKNKLHFVSNVTLLQSEKNTAKLNLVTRTKIRGSFTEPSRYFMSRGFSQEVLEKYDVADCVNPNKSMFNRAVVPIYDNEHHYMIGCSGRSIDGSKPKWKHSEGFRSEHCLYNFWYAKEHIQKSRQVIVVESPGNVWKLEMAGIHNSVAMFGANLADKQKMLLDTSGAMTIIVITDNDDAGEQAREKIEQKCCKIYNIQHIRVSKNDIAELSIEEINQEIKERICI